MISISRPINGITLNGDEFLLDKNKEILVFDTIELAKEYLLTHGVDKSAIDYFNFNEAECDEEVFLVEALNICKDFLTVEDFKDEYFQNLLSVEENIKNFKEWIK